MKFSKTLAAIYSDLHCNKAKPPILAVQIFLEYVMLAKVNDNPEQAHELGKLLSHRPEQYMVNLIPWNPVYSPSISFEAPGPERLAAFHRIVRSYSLHCTVRKEMGQEIAGEILVPPIVQVLLQPVIAAIHHSLDANC